MDAWTRAGAAALCGHPGGPPLGPPSTLVPTLAASTATIESLSGRLGTAVALDPIDVLTERAAITGMRRNGTTSCGGAARMIAGTDGWIVVSLPRADDLDLLPAWLGVAETDDRADALDRVQVAVADRQVGPLADRAAELGLAAAVVGSVRPDARRPVLSTAGPDAAPTVDLDGLVVVDLTALWAGPLCTRILADAGATVVKVESTRRPDGARFGPAAFFDLMNAGKRSVALDLAAASGRDDLRHLIERADVVVEGSRPRALAAMGLTPEWAFERRPKVWVSITGYGRTGTDALRIAFGDDAAAAGGAVLRTETGPVFCADALADPVTGLFAAAATLDALAAGGCWLLDIAMSSAAAAVAPPDGERAVVAPDPQPLRRPPRRGRAAELGADTRDVMARVGR